MHFSLNDLDAKSRYRLITGTVAPRPVALVTTLSASGAVNAAPFSCFNYMGEDPPLIFLGVERYGDESHRIGELKDTAANIARNNEFVVNMTDEFLLESAVGCGTDFPEDVSEVVEMGLSVAPSATVAVPRIEGAPAALECTHYRTLELSGSRQIIVGLIKSIYIEDALIDGRSGRILLDKYAPIARMGGPNYCRSGDRRVVPIKFFRSKDD